MAKNKGLGRGLTSLFDDNLPPLVSIPQNGATTLRLSDVEPMSSQPRKLFDEEALEALSRSIAECGVLQPIIVRENKTLEGTYEIIAGERRWRAAKLAGLSEIPAIVLDADDLKAAQLALIENVQREDLNAVEEACGYKALIEKFDLTQEEVAEKVGCSRSSITNSLRLLDLPGDALDMLERGEITPGHAKALLSLRNEEDILMLARRIIAKGMSVRDTEATVKRILNAKTRVIKEPDPQTAVYIKDVEDRAAVILGRRVKITNTPRKKTVELTYENDDDFSYILKKLCGNDFFDNDR
ncbi:MAG: ParB/RepB/Spo0J family partition protein [Clostridia bacterium]|nr:ParB/RepB/Spo0J family partition protein [Clostridia bacterium]